MSAASLSTREVPAAGPTLFCRRTCLEDPVPTASSSTINTSMARAALRTTAIACRKCHDDPAPPPSPYFQHGTAYGTAASTPLRARQARHRRHGTARTHRLDRPSRSHRTGRLAFPRPRFETV